MDTQRIEELLLKRLKDQLSGEENAELLQWTSQHPSHQALLERLSDGNQFAQTLAELQAAERNIWEKIQQQMPERKAKTIFTWQRMVAAAAIIIVLASGYFWFIAGGNKDKTENQIAVEKPTEILPASTQAVITLSDGRKLVLDANTGLLAQQGTTDIISGKDGQVLYKAGKEKPVTVSYNTLETFKGKQQAIVLPDGSRVTLDAVSKLTYPTAFIGDKRAVSLTGQAYFEVAKNKAKPFIVETLGKTRIEVTGTEFNVNSYPDEVVIKSTLLEGGIKVRSTSAASMSIDLSPGQEVVVDTQTHQIKLVHKANILSATSWKTGVFHFSDLSIEAVMKQLMRHYDFQVEINNKIDYKFNGEIPHTMSLQNVFKVLEATKKVRFQITGRKVHVLP